MNRSQTTSPPVSSAGQITSPHRAARAAENKSSSTVGPSSSAGSRSSSRTRSPTGVPPGSRRSRVSGPSARARSAAWVVLPDRSMPSSVTNTRRLPLGAARGTGAPGAARPGGWLSAPAVTRPRRAALARPPRLLAHLARAQELVLVHAGPDLLREILALLGELVGRRMEHLPAHAEHVVLGGLAAGDLVHVGLELGRHLRRRHPRHIALARVVHRDPGLCGLGRVAK